MLPPALRRLLTSLLPQLRQQKPRATRLVNDELLTHLALDAYDAACLLAGESLVGFRYRLFRLPKSGGGWRELAEPGTKLKAVQRRIVRELLRTPTPHAAALGYRRGKSAADHAWSHAGAALVVSADIADFFPTTRAWRIEEWWRSQGYNDDEARLLTSLTTHRDQLPQGAPTSPALSNLVNMALDEALAQYTRQNGGTYTRYADDLAWSWPNGVVPPADFERRIESLLREAGYRLNPHKSWRIARRHEAPMLVGLVLTPQGGVALPPDMQREMQALANSTTPHNKERLAGYRGYHAMVTRRRSF